MCYINRSYRSVKVQSIEFVLLYLATLWDIFKGTFESEGHLKTLTQNLIYL